MKKRSKKLLEVLSRTGGIGSRGGYRQDIDGLRALAVVAVIFYHAFPTAVRGGFVGVDVFFVISGFLITGIIGDELVASRFTFASFYARRVRRLSPALLLVLAASLAYGFLVLLPIEMQSLGRQLSAATLFASNLLFWHEAGYFDQTAAAKPLLHLWSLGVEEQFYLIWPATLWFLWRIGRAPAPVVVAATTASFALCVMLSRSDPTADFYAPFARFWEFGVGALLAIRGAAIPPRAADGAACLGIALIVAAAFVFDASTLFPGWRALLPVAGAMLLIAAGPGAWINRIVLSNRVAVFLGLISYPLYLWHWPLLSYATILRVGRPLTPLLAGGLLLAAILLAWLTARLVETKLRFGPARQRATLPLVAGLTAIGLAGFASWQTGGFAARFHGLPNIDIAKINAAVGDGIFQSTPSMSVTQNGLITRSSIPASAPDAMGTPVLLTGDSLIYQYAPRVEALYRAHRLRRTVFFVAGPSCSPIPGIMRQGSFAACAAMTHIISETIATRQIGPVVMGAYWSGFGGPMLRIQRGSQQMPLDTEAGERTMYLNLQDDVAALITRGHRVSLLLSSPINALFDPLHMITRTLTGFAVNPEIHTPLPLTTLHQTTADADRRLTEIARNTGASIIDPYPDICGPGPGCSAFFDGLEPKFADEKHLRPIFVSEHIRFLDELLTGK